VRNHSLLLGSLVLLSACSSQTPDQSATGSGSGAAVEATGAEASGADQAAPGSGSGAAAEGTAAPAEDPTVAPADVAAPPADAERSASGLAWRVLRPGTGSTRPVAADVVTVHYAGWTTDGSLFDASYTRNEPAEFPLNQVIAGWTEGLQYMTVGEKRRFWIPVELAYNNRPGRPAGMLVFDVELLEIKSAPVAPADFATPPADQAPTSSGLVTQVTQPGTGTTNPGPGDLVTLHFNVFNQQGMLEHSTSMNGDAQAMRVDQLPGPGWAEAVQMMTAGEKRRAWMNNELAFGGRPGAPEGPMYVEFELISFEAMPAAPATPPDVAAIPADAEVTASGLASRVLSPGTGSVRPTATSRVEVHYTGWTTDGNMFDSSITRGTPTQFPLNGVIAGWTEGVQLMVEGESRRFWIPENLAYAGQPGAPAGMLVFDVQLLRILE
jgi:FKBP-type peptidyl-prolyl cis-trans isomerase